MKSVPFSSSFLMGHHLLLSRIHLLLLLGCIGRLLLLVGLLLLVLLLLSQSGLLLLLSSVGSLLLLVLLLLTHVGLRAGSMAASTMTGGARATHLLVVSLVLGQNLLPHFLSALVNVRVKLVAVLLDAELLVVVDWNENLLSTDGLFLWIVELSNIRVLECLLSS